MRILWDSKADESTATITSSSEATNFDDDNVQDSRLAVRWRATAAASEWIKFDAGGSAAAIFGTTVNLVADPEDLTVASSWGLTGLTASAAGLSAVGYDLTLITVTTATGIVTQDISLTGTAAKACGILLQRGSNVDECLFSLRDITAGVTRGLIDVDWSTSSLAATSGTGLIVERWLDDDTVVAAITTDTIVPTNTNRLQLRLNGTAAGFVYATAVQTEDSTFPHAYVSGTAAAVTTDHTFELPPSQQFVVDCIVRPWFAYDDANFHWLWDWESDSSHAMECYYSPSSDKIAIAWQDGGTNRTQASSQFDDGTSFASINQRIRVIASIDLTTGDTTGSRLIVIPLGAGTLSESTAWSGAIDSLSTTFSTLSQGYNATSGQLSGEYEYLRVYAGTLVGSVSTSGSVSTLLADMTLLFDQTDQTKWTVDAVALAGHNFGADAVIRLEGNNWDIWSYSQDGSAASFLIRETLTWQEDVIAKFITERQLQWWRVTVTDPNNDDAYVELGRVILGQYLQVTPSSFLEWPQEQQRTDRFQYSQGRQLYADVGVATKSMRYQFPETDDDQKQLMQKMYASVGMHTPFMFTNYNTASWDRVPPTYVHLAAPLTFTSIGDRWRYEMVLQEVK